MAEPGELIGPYRLVSQLGAGAMGEVWRARDERLDRYVALKVLPPDLANDAEHRARMLREARAAAAIRHASVVTLFDVVEHRGHDILVMELVEGRTLSDRLRKDGAPPLETALRWLEELADALAAAHARGILHRDIKAANVMITNDGGVKVLDFGLAKLRDPGAPPSEPPGDPVAPHAAPRGDLALDATMPTLPARSGQVATLDTSPAPLDPKLALTQAGSLLGTPMYMAPEQVAGRSPDERTEVFSVGVLAYEVLAGRPPYTATTLEELFEQIVHGTLERIAKLPETTWAIVARALAKDPAARWPSMQALRDAIAAERRRLFAPAPRRWPLVAAAAVLVLGAGGAFAWWHAHRPAPPRPGDAYVAQALAEYDVFYNEKALSSLRAALALAPDHPRALAYTILFGYASDADVAAALAAAPRARLQTAEHSKDRALLDAAVALVQRGPDAARAALHDAGAADDRELAFWTAEFDYRAGHYPLARDEYQALLAEPAEQFRGRIYDHDSAVLLYLDEPAAALKIGTLYKNAFPGEADAVAVYATTLAAAGQLEAAKAAAEDALRFSEGEDTLAGLAKVLALQGDRVHAEELYRRSIEKAGPARRPIRRAALGFLLWMDGDVDAARAAVAPCLPGGDDSTAPERGACLFVAGVLDPAHAEDIARQLDALAAAATPAHPAYGAPASLAALVRARAQFFAGACVIHTGLSTTVPASFDPSVYDLPLDFYAAYHVPFFSTWSRCERDGLKLLQQRSGTMRDH